MRFFLWRATPSTSLSLLIWISTTHLAAAQHVFKQLTATSYQAADQAAQQQSHQSMLMPSIQPSREPALQTALQIESANHADTMNSKIVDSHDPADDDFVFDDALFNSKRAQVTQLKQMSLQPTAVAGRYRVDIYLNQKFLSQSTLQFVNSGSSVVPCLDAELVQQAQLIIAPELDFSAPAQCYVLADLIASGQSQFDFANLRLDLRIPESKIKKQPEGYIPKSEWQWGESIAFINYTASYFQHHYRTAQLRSQTESAFVSLQGGMNFGHWQYRQQASLQYSAAPKATQLLSQSSSNLQDNSTTPNRFNTLAHQNAPNAQNVQDAQNQSSHPHSSTAEGSQVRWQSLNQYFKRPLPDLNSELAMGQLTTSGRLMSGMRFKGIRLNSDDRMLAPVLRSYAPVVRGYAQTQALVTVSQYRRILYQTTVAAGAFEIRDLPAVQGDGELQVLVEETDHQQQHFVVPYSAQYNALREGRFQYHLDLGRARDSQQKQFFANLSGQYGLNNLQGLAGGLSLAQGYQALAIGHQFNHKLGNFNTDLHLSRSQINTAQTAGQPQINSSRNQNDKANLGWQLATQYSRSLSAQQRTVLIQASYFPVQAYQGLAEHMALQDTAQRGFVHSIAQAEQMRIRMNLNQSLGHYGNLTLSTALQHYRDQRPDVYQFQLGYSTHLSDSISLSFYLNQSQSRASSNPLAGSSSNSTTQTTRLSSAAPFTSSDLNASLALSFSPRSRPYRPSQYHLSHLYTANSSNSQFGLNGTLDQAASLNYQLGVYRSAQRPDYNWSAAVQKQSPKINLDLSGTRGADFWQAAVGAQGALALHRGGLTMGSFLSDTFALIEAPGATGAELMNAKGVLINTRGYALLPAMTPYQYNSITLNPTGMPQHSELEKGSQRAVPYAGAALRLKFQSRQGYALLIQSQFAPNHVIPFGTEVFDITASPEITQQQSVGMVGQQGQIYLRAQHAQGRLALQWGDHNQFTCQIDYALTAEQLKNPLIRLQAPCLMRTE